MRAVVTALATGIGVALAAPAVWWEPLHLDEAITLTYARRSPGAIVHDIFVERGGAPLHFLLEHVALATAGGIEALRLPSVVFFAAALVLAGVFAARVAEPLAAVVVLPLLATAPLGLSLATFGRMYALFVLCVLAALLLALRAAGSGRRGDVIAAGAATGFLVYVHPIAPLYAALVAATAIAVGGRAFVRSLRPAVVAALAVAAPYAYALAVLRQRYDVSPAGERLRTTAGRSVPEEALHALTAGGTLGLVFVGGLALAGLGAIARRDRLLAAALAAWIVVPTAFFALVPAQTRFFGRYLAPAEPVLYLLVAAGCLALGRATRRPLLVGGLVAAVVVAAGVHERLDRLDRMRDLGLRSAVHAASGTVLFSSTGTPVADRPPELLDELVALDGRPSERVEELPGIDLRFEHDLERRGVAAVTRFLAAGRPGRGAWIFRGPERRVDLATRRLADLPALEVLRASPTLLVVRSGLVQTPRELVITAIEVRTAWTNHAPVDRWPEALVAIDRRALQANAP